LTRHAGLDPAPAFSSYAAKEGRSRLRAGTTVSAMQLGRLNHVGVATPSIEKSLELYQTMFSAEPHGPAFDLPAQGVRVCFVDTPNSQIELIEPLGDNSPIVKFLEKNPLGGQHHVCFEVPDIHAAKAEFEAKGARVLGEPRIGAHGTLVFFVHPKDMGGVLTEIMETPSH
jgi:methylmalonyl-CoA/ethylmalonyl-CoA epimerase